MNLEFVRMSSLIIVGNGGQGVRFMGNLLAKILILKGYEVSAMYDYDAAMRGGDITAFIVFSKTSIENPLIDKADLLLVLAKTKLNFNSAEAVDFSEKEFPDKKLVNMYSLGFLLSKFKLDVTESELLEVLPSRNKEDNLKAIREGMKL